MRLIHAKTLKIHEFLNEAQLPPFAILSHTWEEEGCTLQQMQHPAATLVSRQKGHKKIQLCCKQALEDGLEWAWIDTCCIDKTSTAELSEAINSMFRWYREARVCYAYLTDVKEATQFADSRWFTRGWTLQELVASAAVWFYTLDWQYLGSKMDLRLKVQRITGIDKEFLRLACLKWIEDQAYSLMGIFDVNMPLLYGEGKKAFARLQEAIMKMSDDQSLFAWGLPTEVKTTWQFLNTFRPPSRVQWRGLFADSPSEFTHCDRIHVLEDVQSILPPIVSGNGVRIELQLQEDTDTDVRFAVIYCTLYGRFQLYLGFPVLSWGSRWIARCGELVTIHASQLVSPESDKPFCSPSVPFIKAPISLQEDRAILQGLTFVKVETEYKNYYVLEDVHCSTHVTYSWLTETLTLSEDKDTLHAVFYFAYEEQDPNELFQRLEPHVRDEKHKSGTTRDETHDAHSFLVTTNSNHYQVIYSAVYPPFALLVGGPINNPWVEAVVILDDEDTEANFETLERIDARLVQSCTTKRHLSSLLDQNARVNPLRGHRSRNDSQLIMCYGHSCSWHGGAREAYTEETNLQVNARLEMVSRNLVQHGLVLLVEVTKVGHKPPEGKQEESKWWAYKNISR